MFLKKLVLKNYRCYENFEIDFPNRLTVIVGMNGAGKSTVLEAGTAALSAFTNGFDGYGLYPVTASDAFVKSYMLGDTYDFQPQYPVEITACGEHEGKTYTWTRRRTSKAQGKQPVKGSEDMIACGREAEKRVRNGEEITLPVIAHYGTGRLWSENVREKDILALSMTRQNGYKDAFTAHLKQSSMVSWFEKMTYKELRDGKASEAFRAVRTAMEKAFSSITGDETVKVEMNLDTHDIDVVYQNKELGVHRLGLSQFSDGYRCTIFLIANIAYRMAMLNPHLEASVLEETDGVVLIDEIDLHLHPAWQQIILQDLMTIFPKVQFIVTTHAPAVIGSVRSENLVILKDGAVYEKATEIFGNDANSIMNEIMEVDERAPGVAEKFRKFDELIANGLLDEAEAVLDEIDALRGNHDKQAAANRVKLKLEKIRGRKA